MKVLVVGDSYCPWRLFGPAIARLARAHDVSCFDMVDEPNWRPVTASDKRIREYIGSPRQIVEHLAGHEVLVVQGAPVTDAVLDAAPELRLLCVARGGPVNVDIAEATVRGIPVVTAPGKNAQAVAELTIAFLVMLARRLPEVTRYVEGGGQFGRDNHEGAKWLGHDLEGHVLGLVGLGQVGRRVALIARALGMRVLAYDPFVEPAHIREAGAEPADLEALLATADFVSIHARATADNRGMVGRLQLAQMKAGGYLINTARDTLVDEDAVYEALRSGHLGGAAFDVVRAPDADTPSFPGRRHPLLEAPNVVITTHVGGATHETLAHGGELVVAEIERLARGEPLVNVANPVVLERVETHA